MAAILFMFIIFPCHWAVDMYKIMILQKPQPFATKFQIDPTVEMWLRVCSNDPTQLTVMQYIFFFKIKNCLKDDLFISCNDRIGKMLHNICISAVAMSLRWATRGPWANCFYRLVALQVQSFLTQWLVHVRPPNAIFQFNEDIFFFLLQS